MKTFRIDYHDGAGEFIYTAATVEKTYSPLFGGTPSPSTTMPSRKTV